MSGWSATSRLSDGSSCSGVLIGISHMGFYACAIQPKVARILDQRPESVTFDSATVKERRAGSPIDHRIADAIEVSLDGGTRSAGQPYRVFVLSPSEDGDTVPLDSPIKNTTMAASGRPFA